MPFYTYAHAEFLTPISEARGGFPQGEPIPVQIEKRGKEGTNPRLSQYMIALDIDMCSHMVNMCVCCMSMPRDMFNMKYMSKSCK